MLNHLTLPLSIINTNLFSLSFAICHQFFSTSDEFIAVPILSILETLDFHSFEPAVACLYVLICSCAFIELFSEMFHLLVTLTTSDWKILSRQIGYEHGDSGSPVLAVFIGGSICAMISFACPLQIIVYFIAGSQLFSGLLRAFYLFYSPFRPKYMANAKSKLRPSTQELYIDIWIINEYYILFQTIRHLATVNWNQPPHHFANPWATLHFFNRIRMCQPPVMCHEEFCAV